MCGPNLISISRSPAGEISKIKDLPPVKHIFYTTKKLRSVGISRNFYYSRKNLMLHSVSIDIRGDIHG